MGTGEIVGNGVVSLGVANRHNHVYIGKVSMPKRLPDLEAEGASAMPSAKDVAQYILSKQNVEAQDIISNLKLQKLTYYAQGFTLALTGKPLFSEEIQAWDHGPVVPSLYHDYKRFEGGAILPPSPEEVAAVESRLSNKQKEIIDEVYDVYGQFSAWKLRNLSHEDAPWIDHYGKLNPVISPSEMQTYFKTLLINNNED